MKSSHLLRLVGDAGSLPTRGAWIEISVSDPARRRTRSLPTRGAWIEISFPRQLPCRGTSLPTRGAWIEICWPPAWRGDRWRRSPHGERGLKCPCGSRHPGLAGRRSPHGERGLKWDTDEYYYMVYWSLPTRGAWIEIAYDYDGRTVSGSRSPHGERGLKFAKGLVDGVALPSLPTRGAWIEIRGCDLNEMHLWAVAPHTGSVD